jgi:hypothetical protein
MLKTPYVPVCWLIGWLVGWLVGCFVVDYFSKSLFSFLINSNMSV